MNKKLMILLLSLSLLQATPAQAGFFESFKLGLASLGMIFSNIFKTSTPPRSVVTQESGTQASLSDTDWAPSAVLGDDPNNYQASAKVDPEPLRAECIPQTAAHRCSALESDQVVANTCVNPVAVRSGSTGGSSGVKSHN
ncbi:hypothetical protein CIK05_15365 [Bdellovibrio sp. qaytius]|nr:hypothetical protein CIK05_15365 [Bdellovibrio sp. qaytius]